MRDSLDAVTGLPGAITRGDAPSIKRFVLAAVKAGKERQMKCGTAVAMPDGDILVTVGELHGSGDQVSLEADGVYYICPATRVRAVPPSMPSGQYTVPRDELTHHCQLDLAAWLLGTRGRSELLREDTAGDGDTGVGNV